MKNKIIRFDTDVLAEDLEFILINTFKYYPYKFSFEDKKISLEELFNQHSFLPIFIQDNIEHINKFVLTYLNPTTNVIIYFKETSSSLLTMSMYGKFSSIDNKDYFKLLKFISLLVLETPIIKNHDNLLDLIKIDDLVNDFLDIFEITE